MTELGSSMAKASEEVQLALMAMSMATALERGWEVRWVRGWMRARATEWGSSVGGASRAAQLVVLQVSATALERGWEVGQVTGQVRVAVWQSQVRVGVPWAMAQVRGSRGEVGWVGV